MSVRQGNLPAWIRKKIPLGKAYQEILKASKSLNLSTVCVESRCPNIGECWKNRAFTLMILGDHCTRNCRFCSVKSAKFPYPPDPQEPEKAALMVKKFNVNFCVITSVTRDDLPDYGASHFAKTVREIKKQNPHTKVELLIPDFNANFDLLKTVAYSGAEVIGHNIETCEKFSKTVRDAKASYERSLEVIKILKTLKSSGNKKFLIKSGFMVGFGEDYSDILKTFSDLKKNGCEVVTVGQYLRPSKNQIPVQKYYSPQEFLKIREIGNSFGFKMVVSGVYVRSSYHSQDYIQMLLNQID